jgi:hypothetical protein
LFTAISCCRDYFSDLIKFAELLAESPHIGALARYLSMILGEQNTMIKMAGIYSAATVAQRLGGVHNIAPHGDKKQGFSPFVFTSCPGVER